MPGPKSLLCKGCWLQMHVPIVLRGPLSLPFRLVGLKPSRMNPNVCTMCELWFSRIKRARQMVVPATVFFADVRGYTEFSGRLDNVQIAQLLGGFYEDCAAAIWERDGIINKLIGDAVLAIFNWPILRADHVRQAVLAGVELQRICREKELSVAGAGGTKLPIGIGVGIHTGDVSIGEVGEFCRDYTAVGPVVNLASRLQGAARPGEVLVTEEVYRQVEELFPSAETRVCHLKGIEKLLTAYVVQGGPG
jgi:adenylate cyclase